MFKWVVFPKASWLQTFRVQLTLCDLALLHEHEHMEISTLHKPRSVGVTKLWKLIYFILFFLCLMAKQVSTRSNTKLTKLVCYLTLAIFANTKESPFGDAQWR